MKGGIILALFLSLITIIGIFSKSLILFAILSPGWMVSLFIDSLFGGTIKYPVLPSLLIGTLTWFFSIILFFLLGALIGWIFGKIKAKKTDNL